MAISKSAKKEDIIAHIVQVMNLEAPEGATKDQLLAFIVENGGEVDGGVSDSIKSTGNYDAASGINLNDRVNIMITKTKETGGQEDVFVGVNGAGFLIKRGIKVSVPMAVVEALNDSVKKDLVEKLNDQGEATGAFEYVDVPAYPFSIVK